MKEWSRDSVAVSHNYHQSDHHKENVHHVVFSKWLQEQNVTKSVFDLGCCSGIVLEEIENHVSSYFGIDLSHLNIEVAQSKYQSESLKFKVHDVEEDISILRDTNCKICYVDSVLTMLEDPELVLNEMVKNFDYVFLNRTNFDFESTQKSSHTWNGMQNPSTLWTFSKDFFVKISKKNKAKIKFYTLIKSGQSENKGIRFVIFENGEKSE
jgi:predicted TPR repeat methyltransferase